MKIDKLEIKNFRGLNFEHDFSNDNFVVLTGVNGSGKSTIIEILEFLLTKRQFSEDLARQITGRKAIFEVKISTTKEEIEHLAERIQNSQPNNISKTSLINALENNFFKENSFKRKVTVEKYSFGWNYSNKVTETINENEIRNLPYDFDNLITPGFFNALSREIVLKLDQLESITLQFSNIGRSNFSASEIFNSSESPETNRVRKTNVNANPLLDSLLVKTTDDSEIKKLLEECNEILNPTRLDFPSDGRTNEIILKRDLKTQGYNINSASSGQKKAIALAILGYVWDSFKIKPVVLIDEPENSMHPSLISKIFLYLNKLTEGKKGIKTSFIIATHSSEVVAANPKNTFRIITKGSNSQLERISGLEERAEILKELGVYFHLDYVARKIVFVESMHNKNSGELSDEEVYQRLIDPQKEEVLFVSAGSKPGVNKKVKFQNQFFEKLQVTNAKLVYKLTDRDDDPPNESNTPFSHIEYLYFASQEVLINKVIEILKKLNSGIGKEGITDFLKTKEIKEYLSAENYKEAWRKIIEKIGLKNKTKGILQGKIIDELYKDSSKQTEKIKKLIGRYIGNH